MAESCRRVLEVEIPQEVVKPRVQAITTRFQRRVRLPGFRPGHAPLAIVEQRFRDDIRSQLLQELVPEYVEAQARENRWELIGTPSITDVRYSENDTVKFKAVLEVFPEIELREYRDLRVELDQPEVTEQEVASELERLREQAATYVNVDPRPLEDGDFAGISLQGIAAGTAAPGVQVEEILCEMGGPNTVPEFTENLRGAQLGEERTFDVVYPQDFSDARLAGKTVSYRVRVLGIKKKQLPELNDDLARELGEFDSLEAVRQRVREELSQAKRLEAAGQARKKLRQQLVELHDFPVPETLVERQLERRMGRLRRQIAGQGVNPQSLNVDWGKLRASQREAALDDVKGTLILEKIAQREQIEVSEAEMEEEVQKLAVVAQQTAAAMRSRLTKEGGLDRLKSSLRIEKALELVFHNATMRDAGRIRERAESGKA